MKNNKWMRWAGLVIAIGGLMRLFHHPKGELVFTVGFAAYFVGKLLIWLTRRVVAQRGLHFLHLALILLALGALLLRYQHYPYANVLFPVALLFESLVNLRLRLNELVGAQTVSLGWQMLRQFLARRRM